MKRNYYDCKRGFKINILLISDTHGHRLDLAKYKGQVDVVLYAGDYTGYAHKEVENLSFLNYDLRQVKCPVFGVPGNHDALFERNWGLAQGISSDIKWYNDQLIEFGGFKIYFMAWMPTFYRWSFMLKRGGEELQKHVDAIPHDIDILVTHGPPHKILDWAPYTQTNAGCELLRNKVNHLPNLLLHVFGHIHFPAGTKKIGDTLFVNASQVNEKYDMVNKPILIEVDRQYKMCDVK